MQQTIDLYSIVPRPELEKRDYHKLPKAQWFILNDAEALLHIGFGSVFVDKSKRRRSPEECFNESAKQGHPVALALLFTDTEDEQKTDELLHDSARRGHPMGNLLDVLF